MTIKANQILNLKSSRRRSLEDKPPPEVVIITPPTIITSAVPEEKSTWSIPGAASDRKDIYEPIVVQIKPDLFPSRDRPSSFGNLDYNFLSPSLDADFILAKELVGRTLDGRTVFTREFNTSGWVNIVFGAAGEQTTYSSIISYPQSIYYASSNNLAVAGVRMNVSATSAEPSWVGISFGSTASAAPTHGQYLFAQIEIQTSDLMQEAEINLRRTNASGKLLKTINVTGVPSLYE